MARTVVLIGGFLLLSFTGLSIGQHNKNSTEPPTTNIISKNSTEAPTTDILSKNSTTNTIYENITPTNGAQVYLGGIDTNTVSPETELSENCSGDDDSLSSTRVCCTSAFLPGGCACFDISTEPFSLIPEVVLPECSATTTTNLILVNKKFPDGVQLEADAFSRKLLNSFKVKRGKENKVYVIVHGWTSSINVAWVRTMKTALRLREPDGHVVLVDWRAAAAVYYPFALANIRPVALMLAQLLCRMQNSLSVSMDNVHIVGHSLGGHLAGLAGTELRRVCGATVGRITGLDPASVALWYAADAAIVDKTDASFVDIIHTNSDDFIPEVHIPEMEAGELSNVPRGMPRPTGHADFWPNGGKQQPGCESQSCSHSRAPMLYLASILNFCGFPSVASASATCAMGFNVDRSCRGDYLDVTTTDTFPFCE